jgi:hypothetical protein
MCGFGQVSAQLYVDNRIQLQMIPPQRADDSGLLTALVGHLSNAPTVVMPQLTYQPSSPRAAITRYFDIINLTTKARATGRHLS